MFLRHCRFELTIEGCVSTFADGEKVWSVPRYNDHHYYVISHRLGYGDDVMRYCREHDFFHHFVAQWFFDSPSQALWAAAHGKDGSAAPMEEMATMAVQRFVRAGERPIVSGVDWDRLRSCALYTLVEYKLA